MQSIDVKDLVQNVPPLTEDDLKAVKVERGLTKNWSKTPFPIDEQINSKVVLYDGELSSLRADCIINPTNENLTQLSYLIHLAGPDLEAHTRKKVRVCSTGDVRVTPGFKSDFSFIIHAVPPKYQPRYKTAAETSLFHTYFRILETMIEMKFRTAVMPVLATPKCNLPIEENFNLQMRIIRRILEKKRQEIDRIVVHVQDINQLRETFYIYFPQSPIDEEVACHILASSIGGINGEPVIPEREIRIKGKPAMLDPMNQSIDLTSGLDLSTVVGKTSFCKMQDDLDKQRAVMNLSAVSGQSVKRSSVFRGCNLF